MSEPKHHDLVLKIEQPSGALVAGEARQAARKSREGWFHRFLVGIVPRRGTPGKSAKVEKYMKRIGFGNWYSEKITDPETGEVLHERHEPLDQHQGHGSAKFKGASRHG